MKNLKEIKRMCDKLGVLNKSNKSNRELTI